MSTSLITVGDDPNDALRRYRLERELTQDQVADLVRNQIHAQTGKFERIDGGYVSKLERGLITWPGQHYRTAFEVVFNTQELGFYHKRTRRDADEVAATKRRSFLSLSGLVGLPAVPMSEAPTRLGHDYLDGLDARITELADLQRNVGGGLVRNLATAEQRSAMALRGSSMTPRVRARLSTQIARLAATAGWGQFDADDETTARELLACGMDAARECDDLGLIAHLAGLTARMEVQLLRPAEALAALRRAAGPKPPAAEVTCAALAARAHAVSGNRAAVTRQIVVAERAFAKVGPDGPVWAAYLNAGKHFADISDSLFVLFTATGRPDSELTSRLRTTIGLLPGERARTRAGAEAKLATVLYMTGAREEGDHWASAARTSVSGVRSARITHEFQRMDLARLALN